MKKAVMVGAGNIGRGFIGAILEKSGWHVTFADVAENIINEINEKKKYTVHIMDTVLDEFDVTDIDGVISKGENFIDAIFDCSLLTTAVGVRILPIVAVSLAQGISRRKAEGKKDTMDVIACENAIRATSILKDAVYSHMNEEEKAYADEFVGFADCAVDRIVPKANFENPLDVAVESWSEWDVEKSGLKGDLGVIDGMTLVDNLQAYIERKLFTLNCGHAITAYLGYQRGKKTILEASADPFISSIAVSAMKESGKVLVKKFGFDEVKHSAYVDKVVARFSNPHLFDEVERVGRDPIRKIGPEDRLVKPLVLASQYGLEYSNLAKGVAAALLFRSEEDSASIELNDYVRKNGVAMALEKYSGLSKGSDESRMIEKSYKELLEM